MLFPALKSAAAAQNRAVDHITLEHDQERALIEEIERICAWRTFRSLSPWPTG